MSDCYVYMMTNKWNSVIYVGMTHDIVRRVYEHKNGIYEGFTKKYKLEKLVYLVCFTQTVDAIACEKRFKKFARQKKVDLIQEQNPHWRDLSDDF